MTNAACDKLEQVVVTPTREMTFDDLVHFANGRDEPGGILATVVGERDLRIVYFLN